jgi:D-aminopeptidase
LPGFIGPVPPPAPDKRNHLIFIHFKAYYPLRQYLFPADKKGFSLPSEKPYIKAILAPYKSSYDTGGPLMKNRKRLRELGYSIGQHAPGPYNSITDVAGVKVGHLTLRSDQNLAASASASVRTGVTAILPHAGSLFREKVIGTSFVINGFGKTTGLVQVEELGVIESPILLTNTFGVPAVTEGALRYLMDEHPEIGDTTGTVNMVVGECNDGYLNDIRGLHIRPDHAMEAIRSASAGPVEEGAVGAGTGMVSFGYKGGIGSSSRQAQLGESTYTVGCLVLTNMGRRSEIQLPWAKETPREESKKVTGTELKPPDGSIMIVLATDAPLSDRQLKRVAKRAAFGLARTGAHASHGSGDVVIAFSTAFRIPHEPDGDLVPIHTLREDGAFITALFEMTAETVEEAIWNSLCMAETTTGRDGRTIEALPYPNSYLSPEQTTLSR